jgi:diguanylate cyclase (GGDEF)-like protein
LEAKDLLKELQRTVDELTVFNEIGRTLTSSLDIDQVLASIMDRISALLKPRNWSLLLLDEATNELYFQVFVGKQREKIRNLRLKVGEGVAGWVAKEKKPVWVTDAYRDPRFTSKVDKATGFSTDEILCVPMVFKDKVLGVIELINVQEGRDPFREADLKVLGTIADYAAIAIENARNFQRVQELTVTDDVTSLYNSRFLHEVLDHELSRAARYKTELSVVFLDLDHFKSVNDEHGHMNGSRLLREVADVIAGRLRKSDFGVRYGGDEFVVLLPQTPKKRALEVARRLRRALNDHDFLKGAAESTPGATAIKLTASFGVAAFPSDAKTKEDLLRAADNAMYQVKNSTRDGVGTA